MDIVPEGPELCPAWLGHLQDGAACARPPQPHREGFLGDPYPKAPVYQCEAIHTELNRRQNPVKQQETQFSSFFFFFLKYFSSALQEAAPSQSNGEKKSILLIRQTADKASPS